MNKVIFNNGVECNLISAQRTKNTIKLFGEDIPQNTSGFAIIRDFNPTPLYFNDFTTIYKVDSDGVTFSNDESEYSHTTKITVNWNDSDDYDGIRPESIDVDVTKDGEFLETITFSALNDWKAEYTDSVKIPTYSVNCIDVQAYEKSIDGTNISFYHHAEIPTPTPEPSELELRVQALEEDINAIDEAIGGTI